MEKEFYEPSADSPGYISFRLSVNNQTPAHFHDSTELVIVTDGALSVVGGGQEYTLKQGDVFFADAYTVHLYETPAHSVAYIAVISARYMRDFREFYKGTLPPFMPAGEDKNAELIKFLDASLARWEEHTPLMRAGFADWVLGYLAAHYPPCEREESRESSFAADVLRYIDEHFTEPITSSDVAAVFGYSPNYFSALFNRCIRENFREYLGGVRLKKTEELLRREPTAGVGAAARLCGFDSPNTYYRAKKRINGCQ